MGIKMYPVTRDRFEELVEETIGADELTTAILNGFEDEDFKTWEDDNFFCYILDKNDVVLISYYGIFTIGEQISSNVESENKILTTLRKLKKAYER